MKGGFALLDDKVSLALVENSALFDFGEMARISPWINKQGVLVLDFVFNTGLKNTRCVQNGRKGGKAVQTLAQEGALASGAPHEDSGQPTNKAAVDWLIMGAEEGTHNMTWKEIEEGADKLRAKGGTATQIVARAGALVSGAPPDDSGQPTNKAAMDWMIMGAEKGTRDMTWEEIEEGADNVRVKGSTAAQITLRAGADKHGAPANALGLASRLDVVNYALNGAEKGCRDKTQEQITEGAAKKRKEGGDICKTAASRKRKQEGGLRGGKTSKAAFMARAKDDRHSHACILPECGMFCTPKAKRGREKDKDTLRIRHSCQVYKKEIYGFGEHICRNCQ